MNLIQFGSTHSTANCGPCVETSDSRSCISGRRPSVEPREAGVETNEVTYFSVMHTPRTLRSPGGFYEALFFFVRSARAVRRDLLETTRAAPRRSAASRRGTTTHSLAVQHRLCKPQDLGAGHS